MLTNTSWHFDRDWLKNGVLGPLQRRILTLGCTAQLFAFDGVQDTFLSNMGCRHINNFKLKESEKWNVLEGPSLEAGHKTLM